MCDKEIETDFDSTVTDGATNPGQPEPAKRRVPNPKGGGAKAIDPQRCTAPDCTTWATHESIKEGGTSGMANLKSDRNFLPMPGAGFEPAHPEGSGILSPRLPWVQQGTI